MIVCNTTVSRLVGMDAAEVTAQPWPP